jgi:putative glutamine amidotransferase
VSEANTRWPRIGITPRFLAGDGIGAGSSSVDRLATVDANNQLLTRFGALSLGFPMLRELSGPARKNAIAQLCDSVDGLLLQGGTDIEPRRYGQSPLNPAWSGDAVRDRLEFDLVEAFLAADKPILGVCRGFQLLQVVFGGSLLQDIPTQHQRAIAHDSPLGYCHASHAVQLQPGGFMQRSYGVDALHVNSAHHQGVLNLASGLAPEAFCADGIIEAFRAPSHRFVLAVQWHPEFHHLDAKLADPTPLLQAFLQAARPNA